MVTKVTSTFSGKQADVLTRVSMELRAPSMIALHHFEESKHGIYDKSTYFNAAGCEMYCTPSFMPLSTPISFLLQ